MLTKLLITILVGVDSENAWYALVKKNFRHLFSKKCESSQFNRTRRNLAQVINLIFTEFARQITDNIFIVDSFPLEVYKFGRAHFCKVFRAQGATYSHNPSKKQNYFVFKVHVITTYQGAIKVFEITPANIDDRKGFEDLRLVIKADSVILGDKGYISQPLEQELPFDFET